jgi:drug/metabolite transporter (DMT)-like permease
MILPFLNREEETYLPVKDYLLLVLSGLFLALHFATWITALFYTTVAQGTLFVDLQPVWASLLGAIFLREYLSRMEIIGVLIVCIGGALSVGPHGVQSGTHLFGNFLAIIGGITGSCYLLIGRKVRNQISWIRYMYSVYYISALWLLLFCLLWEHHFPLPDRRDLIWLALMALIPSILGHGLFNLALRYVKAYVVNSAFLGEPIVATILAFFFFHEKPDAYFFAGAALVFSGLLIVLRRTS